MELLCRVTGKDVFLNGSMELDKSCVVFGKLALGHNWDDSRKCLDCDLKFGWN